MKLAALIFDDITLLDLIGPLEVLQRVPQLEPPQLVARDMNNVSAGSGITLAPQMEISALEATDILVVPGGFGTHDLTKDEALLGHIRRLHQTTKWTVSICTGSLILAAAGLLKNLQATTHWNSADSLQQFGAHYTEQRVVEQGKIITSAGVSSGIDMALALAAKIAGDDAAKAIQLSIEYDPQPPFDAGSPQKAGDKIVKIVRDTTAKIMAQK